MTYERHEIGNNIKNASRRRPLTTQKILTRRIFCCASACRLLRLRFRRLKTPLKARLLRPFFIMYFIPILFLLPSLYASENDMVVINGGRYIPLYTKNQKQVTVRSFMIDPYPVTNKQFLFFVEKNPKWQRSHRKSLFADVNYLKHWNGHLALEAVIENVPVTNVSWFAAKAYCEASGKRLPTVDEWEFVAQASGTEKVGTKDPNFYQYILEWYSKPTPQTLSPIGSGFHNVYDVHDLHGLIWEWTLDFNSALITGESRGDTGLNRDFFCGSGAVGTGDPKNYAAFMRAAFRASLKANYTISNLGFRCAKDQGTHEQH